MPVRKWMPALSASAQGCLPRSPLPSGARVHSAVGRYMALMSVRWPRASRSATDTCAMNWFCSQPTPPHRSQGRASHSSRKPSERVRPGVTSSADRAGSPQAPAPLGWHPSPILRPGVGARTSSNNLKHHGCTRWGCAYVNVAHSRTVTQRRKQSHTHSHITHRHTQSSTVNHRFALGSPTTNLVILVRTTKHGVGPGHSDASGSTCRSLHTHPISHSVKSCAPLKLRK